MILSLDENKKGTDGANWKRCLVASHKLGHAKRQIRHPLVTPVPVSPISVLPLSILDVWQLPSMKIIVSLLDCNFKSSNCSLVNHKCQLGNRASTNSRNYEKGWSPYIRASTRTLLLKGWAGSGGLRIYRIRLLQILSAFMKSLKKSNPQKQGYHCDLTKLHDKRFTNRRPSYSRNWDVVKYKVSMTLSS